MPEGFSFATYVCTLLNLSSDSVTIDPLDGGLTNHTARVIFTQPTCLPCSVSEYESIIVKHAPPYIASLGPDHALSTQRQTVEAVTLESFAKLEEDVTGLNLAKVLRRHPGIRIPELLYHDKENHVLIMSDLGRLPTLLEYLKTRPVASSLVTALGVFLADLHCSTLGASDDALRPFENPSAALVIQNLIAPLPRKLLKSADVQDAETLGECVEQAMASSENQIRCFGMVDLWPGSILVGETFLGLVDWEYAGQSDAGCELGMLTAHLRFQILSPTISTDRLSAITKFTTELLSIYAAHSPPRSPQFIHSALLSHGRELINAVEFQEADLDGKEHKATLIESGARCLRAAGCEDYASRVALLASDEELILRDLI